MTVQATDFTDELSSSLRQAVNQWQPHRKGGASPSLALDRELSAVAIEDVLDQRKPEAGATFGTALGHIDPIEALGEPRNVLGRNARTVVAYGHQSFSPVRRCRFGVADIDVLAAGAIFQRILDQV